MLGRSKACKTRAADKACECPSHKSGTIEFNMFEKMLTSYG